MKHSTITLASLCSATFLILGAAAYADDDEEETPFDEAFIFFELNNTDGDLGIHAKIDGDAWKKLKIESDEGGRKLLDIKVKSKLRQQGLTELFFESAEPTFDELPPETFFERFPEGEYDVEGVTIDGEKLESDTEITHLIHAPAHLALVNLPLLQHFQHILYPNASTLFILPSLSDQPCGFHLGFSLGVGLVCAQ